jgi:hypothetical protein
MAAISRFGPWRTGTLDAAPPGCGAGAQSAAVMQARIVAAKIEVRFIIRPILVRSLLQRPRSDFCQSTLTAEREPT